MAKITFVERGAEEYHKVQIDGETGWVVAEENGKEKWFPPHRVARVEYDRWEVDDG